MHILRGFAGGRTLWIGVFAAICFVQVAVAPKDTKDGFEDKGTRIEVRNEDAVTTNLTVIALKREGNE